MTNRIFKFPNGVTLDLSGIKEEPCKVFIKGGYISRIADRLKKEEVKRVLKNWLSSNPHCFYNRELLKYKDGKRIKG